MSSESGGERRSVSDYMGGVHAGKYDFSAGLSGVTSFAYEKSVVFDDVATGGRRRILAKLEDDAVPKWASRTVSPEQRGTIDLSGAGRGATEGVGVVLSNEEISWEPFFATLETMDGEEYAGKTWQVAPTNGTLAPRGGAENACNYNQPYSDSCLFTVFRPQQERPLGGEGGVPAVDDGGGAGDDKDKGLWLVVRTEMDSWSWRVVGGG
jgi:hypothetical protein